MMINIRLLDILEIGNEYTKNLPLALLVGLLYVYDIFNVLPFSINNINILSNILLKITFFSLISLILKPFNLFKIFTYIFSFPLI